jgi:SAM-dependent methyltransferase
MFLAEAKWLERALRERSVEEISPLLNVGSSTSRFREVEQPWTERQLFAPLRARGVRVIHLDAREGEGIDIRADILDPEDLPKVKAKGARSILCCNILEHVTDPKALAKVCCDIVGPGGLVFVTVPYSYPHHRDPIDTMLRPSLKELAGIFHPAEMLKGEIVDAGESYWGQVRRRPWILLRHISRFPFPFIHYKGWRRSMTKLYWLAHNYKVTAAVFRVLEGAQTRREQTIHP